MLPRFQKHRYDTVGWRLRKSGSKLLENGSLTEVRVSKPSPTKRGLKLHGFVLVPLRSGSLKAFPDKEGIETPSRMVL